jgi:uncharacterized RDD family membrane protein YckC
MPPSPPPAAFIVRGDDGEEYGPADLAELREWVHENRAGLGTVVRPDQPGGAWQPWQNYPELVALLAEAQAGGATPAPAAMIVAPLGRRLLAFLLDLVMAYLLLLPVILVTWIAVSPDSFVKINVATQLFLYQGQPFQYTPPAGVSVLLQLIFCLGITLYMGGFHWAHGQTPAKTLFRLRVVDLNGHKPGAARAFLRGLVMAVMLILLNFFPLLVLLPLFYVCLNPQRRGLHDLATGTCVVEA